MDHRLRFLSWLLVGMMLGGLVWVSEVKAQSRVLMEREEAEKAKKESKPPGEVTPGPKGTADFGYGSVHKPIKGAGEWGQKSPKTEGHVSPSATQAAREELPAPKSVRVPKEPEVPKAFRKSPPEKAKPLGPGQDVAGTPDSASAPGSWVQEEYQKLQTPEEEETLEEEEGAPPKSRKTIREEEDGQE